MRPLALQAIIYGLGTAAGSLANFILLPLYGHRLSPSEFGRLETLTAAQQILLVLCAAGLGSSLFSMYCDEDDPDRQRALSGTALCLVAAISLGVGGLAFVLAPLLAAVTLRGADPTWVRLVAVQASGGALVLVPLAVLRARGQAFGFVCLSVGQVLATALLAAYAVAGLGLGVQGVLTAGAVVSGTLGLGTLAWWAIRVGIAFDPTIVRPLLGLGTCHVPSSLAAWITQLADRYLLLWAGGPAQVGLYGMGYKLGSLPAAAVSQPLALAWPAHLGRLAREGEAAASRACAIALEYAVASAAVLGVAVYLFVDPLLALVAREAYTGSAPVVAWILAGNLFTAAYPVLLSGINLRGRYRLYPLLTGVGAITNLVLNALLIPRMGAVGAAAATAAAYGSQTALAYLAARALSPIAFPWARVAVLLLLAAATLVAGSVVASIAPARFSGEGNAARAALLAAFAGMTLVWLRIRPSAPRSEPADARYPAPGGS